MISAVILTWNSQRYIEPCLRSLFADAQGSGMELEVIVLDNGSQDATLAILRRLQAEYPQSLKVVELERNWGTTVPRNIGIRQSHGPYILILDSDTLIQPGALRTLLEAFTKYDKVGLAAPRLLHPDGTIQPSCKRFPTVKTKLLKMLPARLFARWASSDELFGDNLGAFTPDYCISAAWLLSRRALEDVGLFDENFFYAPEDVDYCLRLWLAGWRVLYLPSATIIHSAQRLSYQSLTLTWAHIQGLYYYFRKHGYWWRRKTIYRKLFEKASRGFS